MDSSHPATKNFEVEDSHPDGGSKGLMEKMKDATRRLKDKVKGTIGHGGKDVDEFDYSSDSSNSATFPEAAHPQYAHDSNPATTYKGTTDYPAHGRNPDALEQRESAPALGAVSGNTQGFHSSNATGIPTALKDTSGNLQKGAAGKQPQTLNTTSLSASPTPVQQGEDTSPLFASATPSTQDKKENGSIDSIDTSSGGFGSFSRPAGTGPYTGAATSPVNQEVGSAAGLKKLLDVREGSGLLTPDKAAKHEGQGQIPSAMGQKSVGGSFLSFGGGIGKEDRGISRTDDFELGRGNEVPKVMTSAGAGVVFGGDGGWSGNEEAIGREDAGRALHGETDIAQDKGEGKSLWRDVKESAAAGQALGVSQVAPLGDKTNESTIQKLGAAAAVTAEKAKVETGFGAEGTAPEKKAVGQRVKDSVTSAAAVVGTAVGSLGAAMGYYGPEGEEDSGSESEDGAGSARKGNDVAGGGETMGSRLSKGVVLAKDTVVASTAVAITAASGVTSTIANKVGYGQQPQGEKGEKLASVGEKVELGTGEGEGVKPQAESYLSSVVRKLDDGKQAVAQRLGYAGETKEVKVDSNAGLEEKVDQRSGGVLSSVAKTIGDGKEAVAQRLGYGGAGKKVEGNGGQGGMKESAQEKSEGYLSSVVRTIGEGKEAVAQRLGYGESGHKVEQDVGQRGGLVSGKKSPEVKSGGGVVGAVAGTVGSLAGTVGGVKDSVVKSMGYGTKQGEGEGVLTTGVKNEGNERVSTAGGTWMDSAYGAASNVAGMAVKAKDVVAEKVGVGKGSSGGFDVASVQQKQAENVSGAVGLPNKRDQQAAVALANVKESVLSTAESGRETVANALGYGSSPVESGGVAVQSDEQGGEESKGLMQSMYNTVASTAGSVKGVVATRLGFGGNETNPVVSEPQTISLDESDTMTPEEAEYVKQVRSTAPPTSDAASGYDKVRGDLSNIKRVGKVAELRKAEKSADETRPNVEVAKYLVDEVRESFGTRQ